MGKHSRDALISEDVDRYGETVMELRAIEHLSPGFLKSFGECRDTFLKDLDKLTDHTLSLFKALKTFHENIAAGEHYLHQKLQAIVSVKIET